MISSTLVNMSDNLRRAAGRRAYAQVESLTVALGAAAAKQARSLPPGDPQFREIGVWLQEQFEATQILLRIARTAHASDLRRIPFLKSYLQQKALSNR